MGAIRICDDILNNFVLALSFDGSGDVELVIAFGEGGEELGVGDGGSEEEEGKKKNG